MAKGGFPGGMGGMNMNNLMKQAQKMQEDMERVQNELSEEVTEITAGGGAVLMAPARRDWIVLKKFVDVMPTTELLPDINCALGWVQLKEFRHNEMARKRIYTLFQRTCMSGKHKMFVRGAGLPVQEVKSQDGESMEEKFDNTSTTCCFPLVLTSSFKDVKQYAAKKDIEIRSAYEDSVIAYKEEELSSSCRKAKSLYLRTALFPLYPRLSHSQVGKIVKILHYSQKACKYSHFSIRYERYVKMETIQLTSNYEGY